MSKPEQAFKDYPPGSDEAIEAGCTCPVMDNSYGAGILGGVKDKDGQPHYWVTGGCPLHGLEEA